MLNQLFISDTKPSDVNLYTALITSDYQVRGRWGWTGFENEYWDSTVIPHLLYDPIISRCNPRIDVNHKRGSTISGFILAIDAAVAEDRVRIQADWTSPRAMNYVLAVLALPVNSVADVAAHHWYNNHNRVGISIEHDGRKPRRTIGPYVTITDTPWNRDCWIIGDSNYKMMYPSDVPRLSESIMSHSMLLMKAVSELPVTQSVSKREIAELMLLKKQVDEMNHE